MIYASKPKTIRVMFTPFRDGLQSSFGGKVRLKDILPAMEASAAAGIRHFEFGGGARYQAPYMYVGEDPFACQDEMRKAVGPDVDLLILTESPIILYPVAFLSVLGVLFLLVMVFSIVWVLLMRQENRFERVQQLWLPIAAGLTLALLMISAIDLLRLKLTGTWGGFPLG